MENFVVSARKYRPTLFDSVVGQGHITTTLKNAIKNNHLAQAFLFCGPRGVGKTTCARILAKTINCTSLTPDFEACGKCDSCTSFQNNASFNVYELDAASNNSVDDIRQVVDQVRYPPQHGQFKVYIIDEVHMLSTSAFNAFLKTLEEPPKYAIFILATTEKNKILPTILSRCQIFDFNRIQVKDISEHLSSIANKEKVVFEDEALRLIAMKADGGLRDALSMFDRMVTFSIGGSLTYKTVIENLHILDYEYFFKITDLLRDGKLAQTLLIFDEILRNGFDGHNFLVGLMEHLRNIMVCKDNATIQLLPVSDTIKVKYQEQANATSLSFILTALNIANKFDIEYRNSKNTRLHIELALMKMAHISQAVNLSQVLSDPEALKKKIVSQTPQVQSETPKAQAIQIVANQPAPSQFAMPVLPSFEQLKNKLITKNNEQENLVNEATETENAVLQANTKLDENTIAKLLQEYALQRKAEDKMVEFMVFQDRPFDVSENTILLKFGNEMEQNQFNALKNEFNVHIKSKLGFLPKIDTLVEQILEKKQLYSSSDKYNHLKELFPEIEELKRRLGLELDM